MGKFLCFVLVFVVLFRVGTSFNLEEHDVFCGGIHKQGSVHHNLESNTVTVECLPRPVPEYGDTIRRRAS